MEKFLVSEKKYIPENKNPNLKTYDFFLDDYREAEKAENSFIGSSTTDADESDEGAVMASGRPKQRIDYRLLADELKNSKIVKTNQNDFPAKGKYNDPPEGTIFGKLFKNIL